MPTASFALLGLTHDASPAEARAAYRRLALLHHPDRNPGDAEAADRFKQIVSAYRNVSASLRPGAASRAPRVGPRPDRYTCGSCGDCFPFPEQCFRCGVALHDRDAGPTPTVDRSDVDAMVDDLLARPELDPDGESALVPASIVAGCSTAALFVWSVGPIGPALLFAGFAAYVAGVELHRRATIAAIAS
ncbi:MAG: J domain-containing protein [Sandaracinaceae bacterium]|nr:J domain-containing protein [Sandaracinaceae bacterium]